MKDTVTRHIGLVALVLAVGCEQPRTTMAPTEEASQRSGRGHTKVQAVAVILPPMIDGKLEEGIWQHTPAFSDFALLGGSPRPPLRPTDFRIAYDAWNVYIGLKCPTDTSIGPPKVRHWQDDDPGVAQDESCSILLWPEPNLPDVYFEFTVNPQAVLYDARRHWGCAIRSGVWDGPTQVAATVGNGAWYAELRIPLVRVGIPDHPWRINVIRFDALAKERSSLARETPLTAAPESPAPASAVLEWPAPARPIFTGPRPVRQLVLDNMEEPTPAWRPTNAAILTADQHATNGRRSLLVSFGPGGGAIQRAPAQSSLGGWETLRLDAYLDASSPTTLRVRLKDVLNRTATASFLARPGANDVALPLDVLGATVWLRNVKVIEISTGDPVKVWLDYLRLEEDSISYHELPNDPPRPSRSALEVRIEPGVWTTLGGDPAIGADVTVPLFNTQKVRRLECRPARPGQPMVLRPEIFDGHDVRDPIRVTAFVHDGGRNVFAFRELRLAQPRETVAFGPADFPAPTSISSPMPERAP